MGLQVEGGELDLSVNAQSSLCLRSAGPHRQLKSQLSEPLFLFAPGLAGLSQVAVSTRTVDLLLHKAFSCLYPTPWPCVQQNPPWTHFCLMVVWILVMRQSWFSFCVDERVLRPPLPPPMLLLRPTVKGRADLIFARSFLILL